jgi:hypothetical protein
LDPRISYEALRKDYADDADLLGDLEISKGTLETHFEAKYADSTADPSEPASALLDPAGSPQKIDFTSRYRRREDSSASDELAEYFRLTSVPEGWEVDPLQWWYSRRRQFPHLYRLVRNVLCIPGASNSFA